MKSNIDDSFADKVYHRQVAHIKYLSGKLHRVEEGLWKCINLLNEMPRDRGVKFNPLSNEILDILAIIRNKD